MVSASTEKELTGRFSPIVNWLVAYLFLWTAIAIVAATTTFIALEGTSLQQWIAAFSKMAGFFYAWGAIALFIYWLVNRAPATRRNFWLVVPLHLALLAAVSALLAIAIFPQNWQEWMSGKRAIGFHSLNALIYSFVLIGTQMLQYYRLGRMRERDAQRAEMRSLLLEKDLSQARIDTLRIQMNPHFLFNALNSISSLISTSHGPEAIRMTSLLGTLLRAALEQTRTSFIPLREELEFLKKYIDIEKIRFGERLHVKHSVPAKCLDIPVPSLVLQPIVENVVKHAVSLTVEPVNVDLRVFCSRNRMTFEVSDDGPGVTEQTVFGCGLRNISERLRLLYGTSATISISNNAAGGALVRLAVPIEESVRSKPEDREKERRLLAN